MSEVSLVITSCGRLDLLDRTLRSFNEHNTHPIAQTILIDDSGDKDVYRRIAEEFGDAFDKILYNDPKLGQIASIDRAYSHVRSPYIFHCEDDWLFFRKGFNEESLSVLAEDERIITVWLRELWDANKHQIGRDIRRTDDGVMYRELATDNGTDWRGFTLNPGLRRRADYERIKPFTDVGHEYEINIR